MLEGIVLKVTHEYSIVKTKTEYLKIRTKPSMEPGQRIYFSKEDILYHPAAKKKSVPALIRYGVAAALAAFILATPLFSQKNAYGTKLLVEVNPSILLNINKDGLIEKAVAYNKDATLLPLENYLNLPVPDAIEEILGDAEAKGFLNLEDEEEDFVVLTEILTSGERLSEEIYTQLEERSLLGDLLSETSLVFTTASEQQLKTVKNEGKALGLMRLREEFNLEPHEKLGDFFKDPVRREAYKEQKRLLKRSTLEEDEDLLEELIEEDDVSTDFKAQLELFKSSINDVKEARKAYQAARKSGDPETIEKTLHALREAEDKRTQLEELKDKLEKAKAEEIMVLLLRNPIPRRITEIRPKNPLPQAIMALLPKNLRNLTVTVRTTTKEIHQKPLQPQKRIRRKTRTLLIIKEFRMKTIKIKYLETPLLKIMVTN
jgi:hypothetical protein